MPKHYNYLVAVFFVWLALSVAIRAQQPIFVLNVSGEASLKTIFDAGLRPTNVSGSQLTKCEIRNSTLVFVGNLGLRVQLGSEQAEFHIAADGTLTEVFAETRNFNLAEALAEAVRLFGLFGNSPPNLNEAVRQAKDSRSFEPLRAIGSGTGEDIEPQIGIGFVPGDFVPESPEELHVRVGVRVYWKNKVWHSKLRKEPIKAPAGYEQFSMEPVLSPSEVRRRRDMAAIAAAQTATPASSTPVRAATPTATPPLAVLVAQIPVPVSERTTPWWPWITGIAFMVVIALLSRKRRT